MNAHVRVAMELARAFQLDPVWIMKATVFHAGLDFALAVMSEQAVIDGVLAQGSLRGTRNPYGAVFARIQKLAREFEQRLRLEADETEATRWHQVDAAARLGGTLADLLAVGQIFADEVSDMISEQFADPDLQAIALAALEGRRS